MFLYFSALYVAGPGLLFLRKSACLPERVNAGDLLCVWLQSGVYALGAGTVSPARNLCLAASEYAGELRIV